MAADSTQDIDEIWDEFEAWLSRNHPRQLASFNPPASEDQLRRLEAELSVSLAPDRRRHRSVNASENAIVSLSFHASADGGLRPGKRRRTAR